MGDTVPEQTVGVIFDALRSYEVGNQRASEIHAKVDGPAEMGSANAHYAILSSTEQSFANQAYDQAKSVEGFDTLLSMCEAETGSHISSSFVRKIIGQASLQSQISRDDVLLLPVAEVLALLESPTEQPRPTPTKVFYSWQSDRNKKFNQHFVKDCLARAIRNLNKGLELAEAIRLDHDTKDVAGSPPIADTILEKIGRSALFVADLSFVAETTDGKYCPNPNVLIEYGYALAMLKDERVIGVMNEEFGPASKLPFDLAHKRWPIRYILSDKTAPEEKAVIRSALVKEFEQSIKLVLSNEGRPRVPQDNAALEFQQFESLLRDFKGAKEKMWSPAQPSDKKSVIVRLLERYKRAGTNDVSWQNAKKGVNCAHIYESYFASLQQLAFFFEAHEKHAEQRISRLALTEDDETVIYLESISRPTLRYFKAQMGFLDHISNGGPRLRQL